LELLIQISKLMTILYEVTKRMAYHSYFYTYNHKSQTQLLFHFYVLKYNIFNYIII